MNLLSQTEAQPLDKIQLIPKQVNGLFCPEYSFFEKVILKKGLKIKIEHTGSFSCLLCGRATKKIFSGFCYPCLMKRPEADQCIMSPHLCHYLKGTCRNPSFGDQFCYQPHIVYLAFTDKFKVGITRKSQVPTRWFDQGATFACPLYEVSSRHQAGVLEKILTQFISDKSHWLKMLKNGNTRPEQQEIDNKIKEVYACLDEKIDKNLDEITVQTPSHLQIKKEIIKIDLIKHYKINYEIPDPIPTSLQSLKLDKTPIIEKTITGMKGQYVFLDENFVFNFRSHGGYVVNVKFYEGSTQEALSPATLF